MAWSPNQYLKFSEPRFRPAQDLIGRISIEAPSTIYDLGCGPGNVTQLLLDRWPAAQITGVDDSAEMLEQARQSHAGIFWLQQSIATWAPTVQPDVVFSNAALHWLPDHRHLFPKLMSFVAPGGILAVQMPRNFGAASHSLIDDVAREGPWHSRLHHLLQPPPVGDPACYYDLISEFADGIDIWETEYLQVLRGDNPVKEWTKGTWLKQFLDALLPAERPKFEAAYAQRVKNAYPQSSGGETLFPFRRLFVVATRRS